MEGVFVDSTAATVILRPVTDEDLPIFFEQRLDPEANHMAAFTFRDPTDRVVFMAHWAKVRADKTTTVRTILADGEVAGNVINFSDAGKPEVGYWLGRQFWGRGIATQALAAFLREITVRPLSAHVAKDNPGSLRVLQKNGFQIAGEGEEFSHARGHAVAEYALILADDAEQRDANEVNDANDVKESQ